MWRLISAIILLGFGTANADEQRTKTPLTVPSITKPAANISQTKSQSVTVTGTLGGGVAVTNGGPASQQ